MHRLFSFRFIGAAVIIVLVALAFLPAGPARASVILSESENGFHYEFRNDAPYMLLRFSTANESGTFVLVGDNGNYAGDLPLTEPQTAGKLNVEIKTPSGRSVEKASLGLSAKTVPQVRADSGAVKKITDLTLTPGDRMVSARFTAPGHHQVIISVSSVMQKKHFTLNEVGNGVFQCDIPMPCVNSRDLVTVTVQTLKKRDLAKASVRTLFTPIDAGATASDGPLKGVRICIDPGHQALEVHGGTVYQYPGSTKRVSGGNSTMAQGKVTLRKESVAVLEISYHLCRLLREQGAEVIMTRWEEEVSVTNMERAEYANREDADYFLRIHLNNSSEGTNDGVYVYGPVHSPYAKEAMPLEQYRDTAQTLVNELVDATGVRGGVVRMSDQFVGNNYAKMPAFLIECGFLSTPANDWILTTADYQIRIARGITNGMVRVVQGDLDTFKLFK